MSWDWDKLKEQQQQNGPRSGPPGMDQVLKGLKNFKIPGGPILIIVVLLLLFGSSSVYTIGVDEVGVIQRFGKYVRTTQPGLNFKLPTGIEKLTKVKVRRVYKEEFGSTSGTSDKFLPESEAANVALMLTGDLNVALVPWIVQYRIRDPYNYLFKVEDVDRLLKDMSEASMRQVVGDRSINEVISKREEIADKAQLLLQNELDRAETGINVVTIEMKRTNVPVPVQPSFNEVNQA
ncbi:MAG: protease modulator HflK, partial [Desulfobacterales bacterium]|nr:protease modulator HflK [Desulfobacterales bacterium]